MTSPRGEADGSPGASWELARRLVEACPAPALVVAPGGAIELVNAAARQLFGRPAGEPDPPLREWLGVGWRELDLITRDGASDLVVDLKTRAPGRRRTGARVRLEPIPYGPAVAARSKRPAPNAIAAFVEPMREPGNTGARRQLTPRASFDALFGHDAALAEVKRAAERFAGTRLPVLLLAETGTGKELLARAIHAASPHGAQPFVAINCGALSPHLLESELFGYAPGAFTGASHEGQEGKLGAARGGTLFLDEVAEMPGPLQALLLRVLEDGTYYRVGDNRPRQANVRLICATCRDLPQLVADGDFRQDLYYRIHGACLGLPPLRKRADLQELVDHLLHELATELALERGATAPKARPDVDPEVRAWIAAHDWPGNVRQLKTALHHALVLADGGRIHVAHLPWYGEASPLADAAPAAEPTTSPPTPSPEARPPARPGTLVERELARLVDAVEAVGGNLSQAAKRLGIARSTLYRRLRKHGLLED